MKTQEDAYRALRAAAETIGDAEYRAGLAAHVKRGRKARTYRYAPSAAHLELVAAMPAVLDGRITVEEACAMLHYGDTGHALDKARQQ